MTAPQLALLALQRLPGAGPVAWRQIHSRYASTTDFFEASDAELAQTLGFTVVPEHLSRKQRDLAWSAAELEWRKQTEAGAQLVTVQDADFPRRLKECPDHPLVLFFRGDPNWNAPRVLAVVGTRRATAMGLRWTESCMRELVRAGVTVVSGLARGIDAAAHRETVALGGETWGVCAHGLAEVYPTGHRTLASNILQNGALISEFPINTTPDPRFFPRRNRIVAGLSDGVLVVESGNKGGSLITARLGGEYNREVLAVPGRPSDAVSQGCLRLIRQHRAQCVCTPDDVLEWMGWNVGQPIVQRPALSGEALELWELVRTRTEWSADDLRMAWPDPGLPVLLLGLECQGVLRVLPGPRYAVR